MAAPSAESSVRTNSGRLRRAQRLHRIPIILSNIKAHAAGRNRRPRQRVLIAEDEARVSERTAARLVKRGMIVRRLRDPSRLDLAMDVFKPDLLILDEHFDAGSKGFETSLTLAMGRHPRTKVIVTVDGNQADLVPGRRPASWGAAGVLEKASMFKHSALETTVEKTLGLA